MKQKVQVWIHRPGPEVLILLTRPDRGGFWQPVTGGVESGERPVAAALREASEESGLSFTEEPQALDFEFTFEREGETLREFTFGLRAPGGKASIRLDSHEHVDSRWVTPEVALGMLKHESNAQALKKLLLILNKR